MSKEPRFSRFLDWKSTLLEKRGLQRPDGRDLYAYRLSAEEFSELESVLKRCLGVIRGIELQHIRELPGFPGLFVLFAAEWWQRRYEGAHWTWDPILHAIGVDPDSWNPVERSECVRLGLQSWGLKPRATGGLRFLGSVAVQGGLPLRLLAEARGGIGRLLATVLRLANHGQVTPSDLLAWVTSQQALLPRSYRQEVIFTLLADVVWTALRLKEESQLKASVDAIRHLDSRVPDWRGRFPLPVGDAEAQRLIEQIIRDAIVARPKSQASPLYLSRHLDRTDGGRWVVFAEATLPENITAQALASLFGAEKEELPRVAELGLSVTGKRLAMRLRRLAGQEAYRIERNPWRVQGQRATSEHKLDLVAPDGRIWNTTVPRGDGLDNELPWVFSGEQDGAGFVSQGSGSVAATEALVALPSGWHAQSATADGIATDGQLEEPLRDVVRMHGTCTVRDTNGSQCRIRTGQADIAEERYEWRGDRYWLDFLKPSIAFKGMPQLYRVCHDGLVQKVEGTPGWRPIRATSATGTPIGPLTIWYPAFGEVKQRTRTLVLPKTATIRIEPDGPTSGAIKLVDWGATAAHVVNEGVQMQAHHQGNVVILSLSMEGGARAPERIEIEVFWPQSPSPARLALPFPAQGVRAFDGAGNELAPNAVLAAQKLLGTRLLIAGISSKPPMSLTFSANHGSYVRRHRLLVLPGAVRAEVRLQDYAQDIQQLLSADDSPDAEVQVTLTVGKSPPFNLRIARYSARMEREESDVAIRPQGGAGTHFPEALNPLMVLALRIERPGDEPIRLQPSNTISEDAVRWMFAPDQRDAGSWLIYPAQGSDFPFRPTLWTIPGAVQTESPLAQACAIRDPASRDEVLDAVVTLLAEDFSNATWTEVEQLAGQLGHLPLATLDLWRRFARSSRGMAAMALRFGSLPSGFLDRFAVDLPFIWEAVPIAHWRKAVQSLRTQCDAIFGNDSGISVFGAHLDARVKQLSAHHGALSFSLGIATAEYFPDAAKQAQGLRGLGFVATARLFDGEDSLLMALRRAHAEDDWPSGFKTELAEARALSPVADYLYPEDLGYPDPVVNIPLLIAAQVATGQSSRWFETPSAIMLVRQCQAFDPEWFEEAFNLTIARCFAEEVVDV